MGKKSRRVRPTKDATKSSPPDDAADTGVTFGAHSGGLGGCTGVTSTMPDDAADTGPASTTTTPKLCAVCGKPGVSSCSACRREFYCGPTCQRSHWSEHKRECTGRCKLSYQGTVNDGKGDGKRETKYEFKEAIESKTTARDWTDQTKGSWLMDDLVLKYDGAKLALRDDWRCGCCGGPATRIVSRVDLHLVAHSKRGSGVTVMALVDQAACNKSACGDYVKLLQDLTAENLKGLNVQPTTNPSAAVGAHFERQRGGA